MTRTYRPALIYVSGPITTGGNVPVNVRAGIEVGVRLMDLGFVVIVPHEKAFGAEMLSPRSYEAWMKYDFRCIDVADALFRMSDWRGNPLESSGGDRECDYARSTNKGVYHSEDSLLAKYPGGQIEVVPYLCHCGNPGCRESA